MSLPAFIDVDVAEQMLELRSYLKSQHAEISTNNNDKGGIGDLIKIIEASSVIWKNLNSEEEIETLMNGILSLIMWFPNRDKVILLFCERITDISDCEPRGALRVQLLRNLFDYTDDKSPLRFDIYSAMVKIASQTNQMQLIHTDSVKLKKWFKQWHLNVTEQQQLLRIIHEGLINSQNSDAASRIMIDLLATYTDDNASQARNEAYRCIVKSLSDPNVYLLDHLLPLKPVKFLEGEKIHDLLNIFVSGDLAQYVQYYNSIPDSITEFGLSHEQNLRKIRLLTFISLAEYRKEISFSELMEHLDIKETEVEEFIIQAVRTNMVRVKIDQVHRRILVDYVVNRSFGRQQWQQLRQELSQWNTNLNSVLANLDSLVR